MRYLVNIIGKCYFWMCHEYKDWTMTVQWCSPHLCLWTGKGFGLLCWVYSPLEPRPRYGQNIWKTVKWYPEFYCFCKVRTKLLHWRFTVTVQTGCQWPPSQHVGASEPWLGVWCATLSSNLTAVHTDWTLRLNLWQQVNWHARWCDGLYIWYKQIRTWSCWTLDHSGVLKQNAVARFFCPRRRHEPQDANGIKEHKDRK